jgi:hypothetical protein
MTGSGLRSTLEDACADTGLGLEELTVLAAQNDPFRVDTPARHRDGQWLAMHASELGLGQRVIHLRGLHYMLVSGEVVKPNGTPYTNTDPDWIWLCNQAAKAARWLGYIDFEQIKDARSSPPVITRFEHITPTPYLRIGLDVYVPDVEDIEPTVDVGNFTGVQPYKLVFFGEKTSLEEVLEPIAERCRADLYLPTGEISDTFLHTMAKVGADDGRPMVVLTFSDCDPAGWQMPISIGRKLQALKVLKFPDLEFQVHRVALTPDHVRAYGLPSTPLKETERRADKWLRAKGVEQTEIDALAALQPDLLIDIAWQAIEPFYDASLAARVHDAREEWLAEAQDRLDAQIDAEKLDRIRTDAATKLEQLQDEIDALNDALSVDVGWFDFPDIVVPDPETDGADDCDPLIDSEWPWDEQTLALKESKSY